MADAGYESYYEGGTSFGAGGDGTSFGDVAGAFDVLPTELVANALTAPTSTPTIDTEVTYYDAAGKVVLYRYIVAVAAWTGVEMS